MSELHAILAASAAESRYIVPASKLTSLQLWNMFARSRPYRPHTKTCTQHPASWVTMRSLHLHVIPVVRPLTGTRTFTLVGQRWNELIN